MNIFFQVIARSFQNALENVFNHISLLIMPYHYYVAIFVSLYTLLSHYICVTIVVSLYTCHHYCHIIIVEFALLYTIMCQYMTQHIS